MCRHRKNKLRMYSEDRMDSEELITFDWVASNFPSMGAAYSARQHPKCKKLIWQNRFGRFVLGDEPQYQLRTRGDVRNLVASLGVELPLDRPPNPEDRRFDILEI